MIGSCCVAHVATNNEARNSRDEVAEKIGDAVIETSSVDAASKNSVLDAKTVTESWKTALESAQPLDEYVSTLASSQLSKISVCLNGCAAFTNEAADVLMNNAIPNTVRHLDLNFESTSITEDKVFASCFHRLNKLNSLVLLLSHCALSSTEGLANGLKELTNISSITVRMQYCGQISCWHPFLKSITELNSLTYLSLNYTACISLSDLDLSVSLEKLVNVQTLVLNFEACVQISSIDALVTGFKRMAMLRSLDLVCSGVENIQTVGMLAESIAHVRKLEILRLDFGMSGELGGCQELGLNILRLGSLRELKLGFAFTKGSASLVSTIGAGLSGLLSLSLLDLDFSFCDDVLSISELGVGLLIVSQLSSLRLSFTGCDFGCDPSTHIGDFGRMVGLLERVQTFKIDLSACQNLSEPLQKAFDSRAAFTGALPA